jgi:transcription initiation factor IIF auxiliary subunit
VQIRSELLRTDGRIRYRVFREGGREHYNLRIYLEGSQDELWQITKVEYLLHPSFRKPLRESTDAASGFAIEIWTWGMFDIQVMLHLRDKTTQASHYYLRYSLPDDTGDNYVRL